MNQLALLCCCLLKGCTCRHMCVCVCVCVCVCRKTLIPDKVSLWNVIIFVLFPDFFFFLVKVLFEIFSIKCYIRFLPKCHILYKQAVVGHFTCHSDSLLSKWVVLGQNNLQNRPNFMRLVESQALWHVTMLFKKSTWNADLHVTVWLYSQL